MMTAIIMIVLIGFVALTVDYGYMSLVQAELQNAADGAALAATSELGEASPNVYGVANNVSQANTAGGNPVTLKTADVTTGIFDMSTATFTPNSAIANAVRVKTEIIDKPLFFAPVMGHKTFSITAEATAMLNPRDIVLVVDLSGSMNDDVEPCWATKAIQDKRSAEGKSTAVAANMVATLYQDLGFGTYPGAQEHVGKPLSVPENDYAYAEMTDDLGPLSKTSVDAKYRILATDSELVRKYKAYAWIIDNQLGRLMPAARPIPTSSDASSAAFWEKYLDYVIRDRRVGEPPPPSDDDGSSGGGGGGGGPSPPSPPAGNIVPVAYFEDDDDDDDSPSYPGTPRNGSTLQSQWIPPSRDEDRIYKMLNPNKSTYPSADGPWDYENKLGYRTYVQFLLDWGRDRSPDEDNSGNASTATGTKTQLSILSSNCSYHYENVGPTQFSFPPRTQPMHACRRSLIRALQVLKSRNNGIAPLGADRIAIVTFDGLDVYHTPQVVVPFTTDYNAAMQACTQLQATSDVGNTTGTEVGMRMARDLLKDTSDGGFARPFAKKVMILLTDGVPNVWESTQGTVDDYIFNNASTDYYSSAYVWYNAALVQAARAKADQIEVHGIGMGIGADNDFMDRMARISGTDKAGLAPRASGDPAAYETELTAILDELIRDAGTRLVE